MWKFEKKIIGAWSFGLLQFKFLQFIFLGKTGSTFGLRDLTFGFYLVSPNNATKNSTIGK